MSSASVVVQLPSDDESTGLSFFPCQSVKQLQYPIVLIHGWGADSQIWRDFPYQLSHYADVYTLDLPGFGDTASLDSYSEHSVLAWLDQYLPETCCLVGLSLGGMLSRAYAAQNPSRVHSVITLGSNIRFIEDSQYPNAMLVADFNNFTKTWHQTPDICLKRFNSLQAQGDQRQREVLAELRNLNFKIDRDGASGMLDLLATLDGAEHIKHINCPSLAIFGAKDQLVPATAVADLPKSYATMVIPQASHLPHLSAAVTVLNKITMFLGLQDKVSIKDQLARSFSIAANAYDHAAKVQSWSGQQLIKRLDKTVAIDAITDLGCGTGAHCAQLSALYPTASVSGIDLAPGMLDYAQARYGDKLANWICCDIEHLSLADNSQSLVFSNFALQWCDNLQQTVTEIYRVLKPGGYCYFAVPGPKTLCELRDAWLQIDTEPRVNDFLSLDAWQNSLQACGFKTIKLHSEKKIEYFTTVRDLMHSIKAVGANVKKAGVIKHTGKSQLQQLYRAYEIYRNSEGNIPATWDIIYGVVEK